MQKNLFERVGGEKAVSDLIEMTYDGVLSDDMISHHFNNTDVFQLMESSKSFFGKVAG